MDRPLRAGIIGWGSFARDVHLHNILKNKKYRVAGTADMNEDAAKRSRMRPVRIIILKSSIESLMMSKSTQSS